MKHTLSPYLRKILSKQGRVVAQRPLPFLLVPLILSVVLSYGFVFMEKVGDGQNALELYIPVQGLSKSGKDRIKAEFGDTYLSQLEPTNGVTFLVLLRLHNRGDILNEEFVTEYLHLRNVLESNQIHDPAGHRHTYANLCWKDYRFGGNDCSPDFIKMVTLRGIEGYQEIRLMTYPSTFLRPAGSSIPFRILIPLGGVTTSPDGFIRSAKAALMMFHFPYLKKDLADFWELQFRKTLKHFRSNKIKISWFTMKQFNRDLASSAVSLKELLPWLLFVIIVFCVASCCVADWVHSKPFLAVGGVFTAMFSIMSGFGILLLCQVQLVDIVFVAPFLVLSIGVDDMFLMLAAWRKTHVRLPVEERMSLTFADAAVSITITSLTDILSFLIGGFSVFPAVKYFCIYAAVSLLFGYIYQITIFGAFMTYSGIREAQNRHCFIMKILPTSAESSPQMSSSSATSSTQSSILSFWYKVFCTGGDGKLEKACDCVSSVDGTVPFSSSIACEISPKDNMFNLFFQRYYAPLLRLKWTKYVVAGSYFVYLFVAIYGTTTVNVGMNYAELLPDNAESTEYFKDYGVYFANSIAPPLEILLPNVDLTREFAQQEAIRIARKLEHTEFTAKAEFWLIDFLTYVSTKRTDSDVQRWTGQSDFYVLLAEFLAEPNFQHYSPHLIFDGPGQLRSSRFFVDVTGVPFGREKDFLRVVESALVGNTINATVFHASFQLAEQQAAVLPATLQTVGAATIAMLVVSFLFIPKLACCLCLAACIISTNLGVVGCMALWGVRLDIVSMITVLMSIGISVDFVAHVSYFYVQAMELDLPVSKAQRALSYLGLPILQGATSTICGMLVLLAINAYMIRAFVKTLLLVIIFGLYHGLLILPIALSLFIRDWPKNSENSSSFTQSNNLMIGTMSERSFAKHKPQCGTMSTALPDSLNSTVNSRRPPQVPKRPPRPSRTTKGQKETRQVAQKQPGVGPIRAWTEVRNPGGPAAKKVNGKPEQGNLWTTPQQNGVDAQSAWLKTPQIRYSEMTRTTRVLNWLLQTPPEGQHYPAYSASSLDQNSVCDSVIS